MRKQEIGKQLKKCKENRRIDIHFNDWTHYNHETFIVEPKTLIHLFNKQIPHLRFLESTINVMIWCSVSAPNYY
jgi:hypothetical protein